METENKNMLSDRASPDKEKTEKLLPSILYILVSLR